MCDCVDSDVVETVEEGSNRVQMKFRITPKIGNCLNHFCKIEIPTDRAADHPIRTNLGVAHFLFLT